MSDNGARFRVAAWLFVVYLVAVILFGAWVRISHAGDGCGANWPTCGGAILPADPSVEARIEFTHRVTSALAGVFGLGLLGWSWRRYGRGPVTTAMGLTVLFLVFEGAIGAGIVLGGLTGDDDSAARAVVIALHLTNTLALTGFAVLAAHRSGGPRDAGFLPRPGAALGVGIALVVAAAVTGAVTALGDTLFPREVSDGGMFFARVVDDISPGNHFLVRLRAVHPLLALAAAGYLVWWLRGERTTRWAPAVRLLSAASVSIGVVDILLGAPGWLQLVHLGGAEALWIALILIWADRLPTSPAETGGR